MSSLQRGKLLETAVKSTLSANKSLLETGFLSDLTIKCKTTEWKVHKTVLCPRSSFFRAACLGRFKEAQTNMIDLSEDDEEEIEVLIRFLYDAEYSYKAVDPLHRAKMYIISQRLDVQELAMLSVNEFEFDLNIGSTSPPLAAEEITPLVSFIYEHTMGSDQALRKPLASFVARHFEQLMEQDELELKQMFIDYGEFGYDVLRCSREQ